MVAIDIHGRMEALDQSIRSVDYRLRAVEKRLSIKTSEPDPDSDLIIIDDLDKKDIQKEIEELRRSVEVLSKSIDEIKNEGISKEIEVKINDLQAEVSKLNNKLQEKSMESQLADAEHRITKLENLNKITIGKIKVPIEFSGLVAAVVLLCNGYLIYIDQWNIIRSSYYPAIVGILFGGVVIIKFLVTNRN